MITLRRASDRGHFDFGWLKTFHTFSFGDYIDPNYKGFRTLRVINEDFVQEDQGFQTHGHRDMEIITYVMSGVLAHKDSMGNGSEIPAGDFQYMSAGTGVTHSEINPSKDTPVHLYQIWIRPAEKNVTPRYAQITVAEAEKEGKFQLVASRQGENGAMAIHQDAKLFIARLRGAPLQYPLGKDRGAWVQAVCGTFKVNGQALETGDGVAIEGESELRIEGTKGAELLLFDL